MPLKKYAKSGNQKSSGRKGKSKENKVKGKGKGKGKLSNPYSKSAFVWSDDDDFL